MEKKELTKITENEGNNFSLSSEMQDTRILYHTCSKDCFGSCVFQGVWKRQQDHKEGTAEAIGNSQNYILKKIKASKEHPFTQGFFCNKFNNRIELLYHEDRLIHPLKRVSDADNSFSAISLEQSIEEISKLVIETLNESGPKSILGAFYSGNTGIISSYAPLSFFNAIGALSTTGGICNEGGCEGLKNIFGTYSLTNPLNLLKIGSTDADGTGSKRDYLFVAWGANLFENNIHLYSIIKKLRKNTIKKRLKLVTIEVRKTRVADESDLFIQIPPLFDPRAVFYILKKLYDKKEFDMDFLRKYVSGYEQLLEGLDKIKAQSVLESGFATHSNSFNSQTIFKESINLIRRDLDSFIELLIEYKHRTLFNIGYGPQKYQQGGLNVQIISLIQIVLGNFPHENEVNLGKIIGFCTGIIYSQSNFTHKFSSEAIEYVSNLFPKPALQSPSIESSKIKIQLINLPDELEKRNIRLLFIWNFNPLNSLPDQNKLRKIIENKRKANSGKNLKIIVLDIFPNETTEIADYIIPAKFDVETADIYFPYFIPQVSISESLSSLEPALLKIEKNKSNNEKSCPYNDCISNFDFFKELMLRIITTNSAEGDIYPYDKFKQASLINDIINKLDELNSGFNKDNPSKLRLKPKLISENLKNKGYHLFADKSDIIFKLNNDSAKIISLNGISNLHNPSVLLQEFNFYKNYRNKETEKSQYTKRESNKALKLFLITPNHGKMLHSQLGRINSNILSDFDYIYLNAGDLKYLIQQSQSDPDVIQTEERDSSYTILVENKFANGLFKSKIDNTLPSGVCMLFSGGTRSFHNNLEKNDGKESEHYKDEYIKNANFFTCPVPEEIGKSGAYNHNIVRVSLYQHL